MSSLPFGINDKPHPVGDECMPCGRRGWEHAKHKMTADNKPVTVAAGYGDFEGYLLVAEGHLTDGDFPVAEDSFRSTSTERRVVGAHELSFAD